MDTFTRVIESLGQEIAAGRRPTLIRMTPPIHHAICDVQAGLVQEIDGIPIEVIERLPNGEQFLFVP